MILERDSEEDGTSRAVVEVTRGGVTESEHRVHVAVVDERGRLLARVGDPERVTFLRSAAKPFQALPLVEDDVVARLGLSPSELALCCGSHSGQPVHVNGVRSILGKAGLDEDALECGPHRPFHTGAADALVREGREPGPIHNNCSGKHAGMLALAAHHGWPLEGYVSEDHPVQQRMLQEVSRWSQIPVEQIVTGVDGCGVVCFAAPLSRMAGSFARLAEAEKLGEPAGAVLEAMGDHPLQVAGAGRLCTRLIEATGGRVVAKTGAEGVYCASLRGKGIGLAVKVEDGARRASGVALVEVLRLIDALDEGAQGAVRAFAPAVVENTRGTRVGQIRADFRLEEPR